MYYIIIFIIYNIIIPVPVASRARIAARKRVKPSDEIARGEHGRKVVRLTMTIAPSDQSPH